MLESNKNYNRSTLFWISLFNNMTSVPLSNKIWSVPLYMCHVLLYSCVPQVLMWHHTFYVLRSIIVDDAIYVSVLASWYKVEQERNIIYVGKKSGDNLI